MTTDIRTLIRFGGTPTGRPARTIIGESLRIFADFQDAADGTATAVTGAAVVVVRPDGLRLAFDADSLTQGGTGTWFVDVTMDVAGLWRIRAECTGPTPSAAETTANVAASSVATALPAAPALMTQDLAPLVTQPGGVLTVMRITDLPETLDPAGLVLAGAQGGEARHVAWEVLAAGASAAGAQAGTAAGATAGTDAGAAAVASHAARTDNPHGVTAAQTAFTPPGGAARTVQDELVALGAAAIASTVTINPDGSITETRAGVSVTTTFGADGSITETYGAPLNRTLRTTFDGATITTAQV